MKHQLKYIHLFESEDIIEDDNAKLFNIRPGNRIMDITFNSKILTKCPPIYNEVGNEITGWCMIKNNLKLKDIDGFYNMTEIGTEFNIIDNPILTKINGFNKLKTVGFSMFIGRNPELTQITGFDSLESINWNLIIEDNPKLILMSLPKRIITSVNYEHYRCIKIEDGIEIYSPEEYINSPVVIGDLVSKLNPGYHSTQVGIQIWENLKEWGTQVTIDTIIARLTPEQWELFPDDFKHLYHPDYKSTSGRDVAKLNTGQIYGIF